KMTHALRSAMCAKLDKLPAEAFVNQESGAAVSRFVGDVDTVEELFTSGIISMFADACRLCGILAVIFAENRGLALILLVVLPLLYLFTRVVQKRMLKAQLQRIHRGRRHQDETRPALHRIRHARPRSQTLGQRFPLLIRIRRRGAASPPIKPLGIRISKFRVGFFSIDARFGYRPFPCILRQAIRSTRMRGSC
ncbi:ABC-type multidrug transport system, ATPase and permease component, partial [human gut metagenome]